MISIHVTCVLLIESYSDNHVGNIHTNKLVCIDIRTQIYSVRIKYIRNKRSGIHSTENSIFVHWSGSQLRTQKRNMKPNTFEDLYL